jgi:hypothetical protein
VREAVRIARARRPDLKLEGPIQYDAAVDASVARSKMPDSEVAGQATVFIFPDLNTGNNTYKAVQRSAGAVAIGPVLQGLNKPVNDLSRGCTVTTSSTPSPSPRSRRSGRVSDSESQRNRADGPPRPQGRRGANMKILVLNSGSSSIKFQLFQAEDWRVAASGAVTRIGEAVGDPALTAGRCGDGSEAQRQEAAGRIASRRHRAHRAGLRETGALGDLAELAPSGTVWCTAARPFMRRPWSMTT